jgi:hypothetical protein
MDYRDNIFAQLMIDFPPGSDIAKRMGCKCNSLANSNGEGYDIEHDESGTSKKFEIDYNCPLHSDREDIQNYLN